MKFTRLFLFAVVLLAGLTDAPQRVHLGLSGLGLLTLATCGVAWMLWMAHLDFPVSDGWLMPMGLLILYAVLSLTWSQYPEDGLQNVAVLATFLGLILLSAHHATQDPRYEKGLRHVVTVSSLLAAAIYFVEFVTGRSESESHLMGARSFALFAMIGVAHHLAMWRQGHRRNFIFAAGILLVIFLSMSRMALVASVALVPISVLLRGGRLAALKAMGLTLLAGGGLVAVVFLYQPLYDRFFGYDASLSIGGVNINAMGRAEVWEEIYASMWKHPFTGFGAGSTVPFTKPPDISHPHNDYLLFAHDYGLMGLACWMATIVWLMVRLTRLIQRQNTGGGFPALPLAALLALIAVSLSMASDNSATYAFVMAPLGVLIGSALGAARKTDVLSTHPINPAWDFAIS